jgi:hypothetical protein
MVSLDSKQRLQQLTQLEFSNTDHQKQVNNQASQLIFLKSPPNDFNTPASMAEWDADQDYLFKTADVSKWVMDQTSEFPNAWGYFVGGHKKTPDQKRAGRFALRLFFGEGVGVFVRAERFYHIPKAFTKERKAPISEVQVGTSTMRVLCEAMFPFRMWSVDAGQYFSLNFKALVVEDLVPDTTQKAKIDVYLGTEWTLPFRFNYTPRYPHPIIELDAISTDTDAIGEEYVDIGAWTNSTRQEPDLRPRLHPTKEDARRHQELVNAQLKLQKENNILALSAAGATPCGSSQDTEDLEVGGGWYDKDEIQRLLEEDARRQLEGGDLDG